MNILAVEFLRQIDKRQDYAAALQAVMEKYDDGRLHVLMGDTMRSHVPRETAEQVLDVVGFMGRSEASAKFNSQPGLSSAQEEGAQIPFGFCAQSQCALADAAVDF